MDPNENIEQKENEEELNNQNQSQRYINKIFYIIDQ